MSDFALAMELAQAREEIKTIRHGSAALRQAISCARCHICNEKIGDQDWEMREIDDTDDPLELVHAGCQLDD